MVLLILCVFLYLIWHVQQHQLLLSVVVAKDQLGIIPVVPSQMNILNQVEESLAIYRSIKNEMMVLERKQRALLKSTMELENRVWSLRTNTQSAERNLTRIQVAIFYSDQLSQCVNTFAHLTYFFCSLLDDCCIV